MYNINVINGLITVKLTTEKMTLAEIAEETLIRLGTTPQFARLYCIRLTIEMADGVRLGTYYYESGEFYPSEFYDDNPLIARLWG